MECAWCPIDVKKVSRVTVMYSSKHLEKKYWLCDKCISNFHKKIDRDENGAGTNDYIDIKGINEIRTEK